MASALPAIQSPGGGLPHSMQNQLQLHSPSPHQKAPHGKMGKAILINAGQPMKRSQSKKERELEYKKLMLRQQQPMLSKRSTAKYRNTYMHNLCLDMLQQGYHKSFAELFALVKLQNVEREAAGPESALWNKVLLENEHEKLEQLKHLLSEAENASRKDNFNEVYNCQYQLASYFQLRGDKWLADHFYSSCLATAIGIKGDDGKKAAEGYCNVGLALEESGDCFGAAEHLELFYNLSTKHPEFEFSDGVNMHCQASNLLSRIYTTISTKFHNQNDLKQYLQYLKKAYDMAKESGDQLVSGEASYRLGLAYEKNKDSATALVYLNGYLDICQNLGDNKGIGKACEAIAKSYESQGKIEECIKYLEMFVNIAEKHKDDKHISRACSNLGAIFNSLGRYDQAVEYFNKAYNIARSMNDTETISSSRVLFGVAAAHKMLEGVASHIEIASAPCLNRIVEWKDNRGDDFDKEIPVTAPSTPPSTAASKESEESKKSEAEKNDKDD